MQPYVNAPINFADCQTQAMLIAADSYSLSAYSMDIPCLAVTTPQAQPEFKLAA